VANLELAQEIRRLLQEAATREGREPIAAGPVGGERSLDQQIQQLLDDAARPSPARSADDGLGDQDLSGQIQKLLEEAARL